ncbi:unnamed protein product, partial [Brenthis ino]
MTREAGAGAARCRGADDAQHPAMLSCKSIWLVEPSVSRCSIGRSAATRVTRRDARARPARPEAPTKNIERLDSYLPRNTLAIICDDRRIECGRLPNAEVVPRSTRRSLRGGHELTDCSTALPAAASRSRAVTLVPHV